MAFSFAGIIAPNPILNANLDDGQLLVDKILAAGISTNPRLYANGVVVGAQLYGVAMYPATAKQDNSDLPAWATNNWDGDTTLESIGLPATLPVYLQVFVAERGNFYDVAQVNSLLVSGVSLDKALF